MTVSELKVASFNIRLDTPVDGIDRWSKRKNNVLTLLKLYDWDILGLQEVKESQFIDLHELTEYAFSGKGRTEDEHNEYSSIMYKKECFELLDEGTFWLSLTPKIPSQAFEWDADCPRVCSWVKLKRKETKQVLIFMNTHFDHIGEKARYQSALLIKKKIEAFDSEIPIILTGDFNGESDERWYGEIREILADSLVDSPHHIGPFVTCTGVAFSHDHSWGSMQHIDYVFCSDSLQVKQTEMVTDRFAGRYPSDHFPVSVTFQF